MKIKEFTITNFKSFSSTNGKLSDLKTINMIYGDNNSGKSNILRFVDLIFKRKIDKESPLIVDDVEQIAKVNLGPFWKGSITKDPYIYHKNIRTNDIQFKFEIELNNQEIINSQFSRIADLTTEYFIAGTDISSIIFNGIIRNLGEPFTSEMKLEKVEFNGKEMYLDTGVDKFYFRGGTAPQSLFGDSTAFENLFGIFNDIVLFLDTDRFLVNEQSTHSNPNLTPKTFKNWLHNLSLDPLEYKKYEKFITFIKTKNVSNVVFRKFELTFARNSDGEIEVMLYNGTERLPLSSYGTGIQQILYILSLLFETKSRIILVEELELNLSPKLQRELFQIFRTLKAEGIIDQVIFTTHSGYFKFVTDFSMFEVTMNKAGASKVEKVAAVRKSFFNKKGLD